MCHRIIKRCATDRLFCTSACFAARWRCAAGRRRQLGRCTGALDELFESLATAPERSIGVVGEEACRDGEETAPDLWDEIEERDAGSWDGQNKVVPGHFDPIVV